VTIRDYSCDDGQSLLQKNGPWLVRSGFLIRNLGSQ
jgi:hypothetical protein